ncbi:MAG TPA: ABC transporter substrate-binding protein [Methylomirabilota bacterium]|nr:ABC transporter substrate-binding protein [Methylomirabilota bacterium]
MAVAQTPSKTYRVGVLASSTEVNFGPGVKIFREALHAAGWVEGQNLALDVRYTSGYAQLKQLATELVRLKVDVIAALGTPAIQAAKEATTTIPIVMESLSDVVAGGLVQSLARPGGNVTGVSGFAPELSGKRLELIREILPRAERIAVLVNRSNPVTASVVLRATETAAQQMRMKLDITDVQGRTGLAPAFEAMQRKRADALMLVADPALFTERPLIVELAAKHRLPAIYETRGWAESGGFLSYGPRSQDRFQRMAVYVDRILRGANPGDLPIERPTTFELIVNLKTAQALGLTIPQSVLVRADEIIR